MLWSSADSFWAQSSSPLDCWKRGHLNSSPIRGRARCCAWSSTAVSGSGIEEYSTPIYSMTQHGATRCLTEFEYGRQERLDVRPYVGSDAPLQTNRRYRFQHLLLRRNAVRAGRNYSLAAGLDLSRRGPCRHCGDHVRAPRVAAERAIQAARAAWTAAVRSDWNLRVGRLVCRGRPLHSFRRVPIPPTETAERRHLDSSAWRSSPRDGR